MNHKARLDALAAAVADAGLLDAICWTCEPDEHRRLGTLVVRSMEEVSLCAECGAPVDKEGQSLGTDTTVVMVHGRKTEERN